MRIAIVISHLSSQIEGKYRLWPRSLSVAYPSIFWASLLEVLGCQWLGHPGTWTMVDAVVTPPTLLWLFFVPLTDNGLYLKLLLLSS